MELSKFKTELSKISGVDFHSPKYREIFKRYFGAGKDEGEETDELDDAKAKDEPTDEVKQDIEKDQAADEGGDDVEPGNVESDDSQNDTTDENSADNSNESDTNTLDSTEEEKALERIIGDKDADSESDLDGSQSEDGGGESEVQTEDEAAAQDGAEDISQKLLSTQLELELVRAGIREDRMETAKRLFMPEFKSSGGNIEQIRELISKYPEWIGSKSGKQGFGMPLGDKADALTNEEKALKRMGIDPRN